MSSPISIAIVAEGPTDSIFIQAALTSILAERSFTLIQLQPESSLAFPSPGDAGPLGGGWKGVHKWCRQATARAGGQLRNDPLFLNYDLLILHLDADVAGEAPPTDLPELLDQLPCERPCPPASDTVIALRQLLLAWLGETAVPTQTVLCIPSKSTEAWVLTALFPNDAAMTKQGPECHPDPAARLPQQKLAVRITKSVQDYRNKSENFSHQWPTITRKLAEAARFDSEFRAAIPL